MDSTECSTSGSCWRGQDCCNSASPRLLIILLLVTLHVAADASDNSVSSLKDFISNPPTIRRLVFEARQFGSTASADVYYVARWQKDAFFLRCFHAIDEIGSDEDKLPVYQAAGMCGGLFWTYADDVGLSTYTRTTDSVPGETTNGVYQLCMSRLDLLSWVMNAGIPNQDPASIRWEGQEFARTNRRDIVWSGRLDVEDERPLGVSLTAHSIAGEFLGSHEVEFEWLPLQSQTMLPAGVVQTTILDDGTSMKRGEFRVHSLLITNSELPELLFRPDTLVLGNQRRWLFENGRMHIALTTKSKFEPVRYVVAGSADDPSTKGKRLARAAVIGLLAFVSIVFVFWLLRARHQR